MITIVAYIFFKIERYNRYNLHLLLMIDDIKNIVEIVRRWLDSADKKTKKL